MELQWKLILHNLLSLFVAAKKERNGVSKLKILRQNSRQLLFMVVINYGPSVKPQNYGRIGVSFTIAFIAYLYIQMDSTQLPAVFTVLVTHNTESLVTFITFPTTVFWPFLWRRCMRFRSWRLSYLLLPFSVMHIQ